MKKKLFSLLVIFLCCIHIENLYAQTFDNGVSSADNSVTLQEIHSSSFSVSTNKTFHLIFPNEVKYFSIGDENVAGEKIDAYPCAIRPIIQL